MVTIAREQINIKDNNAILELRGLSTDTKPTDNVSNGSVFIEIDTGNIFFFDGVSKEWKGI